MDFEIDDDREFLLIVDVVRLGNTDSCEPLLLLRLFIAAAESFPLRLLALLPELLLPLLCRALLPVDRLLFELPRLLTAPLPDELLLLLRCRTVPLLRLLLLLCLTLPLLRLLLLPLLRTVLLPERLPDDDLFTDRPLLLDVDLLLTVLLVVPRDRTVPVERRILEREVDLSI